MEFPVRIPLVNMLGFELLAVEPGRAELAVTITEPLTNSWGVAHGGTLMALLDVALAHAALSPTEAGGPRQPGGAATIEMKTSFLSPGEGRLVARAQCLRRSASLAFCEGRVLDDRGTLVAHATGTFKLRVAPLAGPDGRPGPRPKGPE